MHLYPCMAYLWASRMYFTAFGVVRYCLYGQVVTLPAAEVPTCGAPYGCALFYQVAQNAGPSSAVNGDVT